jgi:hypothetical protein
MDRSYYSIRTGKRPDYVKIDLSCFEGRCLPYTRPSRWRWPHTTTRWYCPRACESPRDKTKVEEAVQNSECRFPASSPFHLLNGPVLRRSQGHFPRRGTSA